MCSRLGWALRQNHQSIDCSLEISEAVRSMANGRCFECLTSLLHLKNSRHAAALGRDLAVRIQIYQLSFVKLDPRDVQGRSGSPRPWGEGRQRRLIGA